MGLMSLLLNNEKNQRFDFLTLYPCHKGTRHMMTINKIFRKGRTLDVIKEQDI